MALVHTAGTGFASDDGGFVEIEAAATGGASPVGTLRSFGADWSGARRGGIDEVPQAYGQLASLVDELYVQCDGVTTPDGLYFDPDNSIEGKWSDQVKAAIKIATERCGCDGSTRLSPPPGASTTPGRLLVAALTAVVSWFAAGVFFGVGPPMLTSEGLEIS
eukprot:jgi/Undpi1/199/HiC_scaffold_1.g00196.m1